MSRNDRRQVIGKLCGLTALFGLPHLFLPRYAKARGEAIFRVIPKTQEKLPCIGMGSHRTFDVEGSADQLDNLASVLNAFFANGGAVIDSSPMYGNAEKIIGDVLARITNKQNLFAATKVWSDGKQQGIEQMLRSMQRMRVKKMDLMQIHNLRDWKTHLQTLKQWKVEGKIRYIGITTSRGRDHEELIDILKKEAFDFVQFSYNVLDREVERYLLPMAQDKGIATLINRPFQKGDLFRLTKGKPLPSWASQCDSASWAQVFLKFALSHPAVTCIIPATSNLKHMQDNMQAGFGRIPDGELRQTIIKYVESL